MDNNEDELMAGADSEERDHNLGYEEEMEGEDGGAEMDAEAIDPIIDADSFVSPTKQSDPSAKKKTVKKPLTAFILYMGDMREKLMKENPGLKFGEIGKMVGEMYKGLSAEERDHYSNLAKQDKERYIREYEEFKAHSALHPEEYAVPVAKISDTTLTIPVGRVKRILKLDPEVKAVSKEASVAITKATELFIAYLAVRSHNLLSKRKGKSIRDVELYQTIHTTETLQFLRVDFPKTDVITAQDKASQDKANSAAVTAARAAEPPTGVASIRSFFQSSATSSSTHMDGHDDAMAH